MPRPSLNVSDLSHHFGPVEILDGINLRVEEGRVVSIVGPSGCGKTTLLHLCAGLITPSKQIVREGLIEQTDSKIQNDFKVTSCMFQEPRLLAWKSTLDNVALGLKARGVPKTERRVRAGELAVRFGLRSTDLEKYPHDLSGGMRQRAALARAMAVQPELLLLDEPFSALDIGLKADLHSMLIEQMVQHRPAVLFITHDLMEAVKLSHEILVLSAHPGKVVHEHPVPETPETRSVKTIHRTTEELLAVPEVIEAFRPTD